MRWQNLIKSISSCPLSILIPIVISCSLGGLERAIMYAFSILSLGSSALSFLILSAKCSESVHRNFEFKENEFEEWVKRERILEVVGILCLYVKACYYLSLFDSIAPLIDIMFKIMWDIKWFLFILVLSIFAFSHCFCLLGLN